MKSFTLNIHGHIREVQQPLVMGILNATPDSFYSASRTADTNTIGRRAEAMIAEGVDIIDVGGYSTRPGAADVAVEEELSRVKTAIETVRSLVGGKVLVSVDTFRSEVAAKAVEMWGADIVNDISGGSLDAEMFQTVARLRVPYILTHMRGTPATMAQYAHYPQGVAATVACELSRPLETLRRMGVADVIVDPGFGFAKTLNQNYQLLASLPYLDEMMGGAPLLVGMSRKSMATKLCGITPEEALPATVALNTVALLAGAAIVRVHDVAAARQSVAVVEKLKSSL